MANQFGHVINYNLNCITMSGHYGNCYVIHSVIHQSVPINMEYDKLKEFTKAHIFIFLPYMWKTLFTLFIASAKFNFINTFYYIALSYLEFITLSP